MLPVQQHSHVLSAMTIANELDRRGHEVHVSTLDKFNKIPVKSGNTTSKIKLINVISSHLGASLDEMIEKSTRRVLDTKAPLFELRPIFKGFCEQRCLDVLMNGEEALNKLKGESFDIAIVDGWLFTKCFYLIPHRLGIPWITYTTFAEPFLIRTPSLPSFVNHMMSGLTDRMSFFQRFQNTVLSTVFHFNKPSADVSLDILDRYRKYGEFNNLDELVSRSKLFLVTSDVVLDYAKPSMPNVVEIGGLTTAEPKSLPESMQTFMDEAELGVIVVSFGSTISKYPAELAATFSSVFSRMAGYRVVWRLAASDSLNISNNVLISEWLPQRDILAHPKTKLFITHCGNNGQYEAVYSKVYL